MHKILKTTENSNLANMGVGNSTIPSVMFMLEPAVATVSICLPAISALVTRGFQHMSSSYIRSTWSKRQSSSRSTNRVGTKPLNQTRKSFPYLVRRRDTADSKRLQLLPITRRNSIDEKHDVNRSATGDMKNQEAINVAIERPRSAFSPVKSLEERSLSKSLGLERRVRQYYRQSEFPDGAYENPDLENAGSPSSKIPLPVPPKDSLDPAPY